MAHPFFVVHFCSRWFSCEATGRSDRWGGGKKAHAPISSYIFHSVGGGEGGGGSHIQLHGPILEGSCYVLKTPIVVVVVLSPWNMLQLWQP